MLILRYAFKESDSANQTALTHVLAHVSLTGTQLHSAGALLHAANTCHICFVCLRSSYSVLVSGQVTIEQHLSVPTSAATLNNMV